MSKQSPTRHLGLGNFLGLLRDALGLETRALVKHEVRHEYTQGSDDEIHAQILKAIAEG